jgi:hypothetical protein
MAVEVGIVVVVVAIIKVVPVEVDMQALDKVISFLMVTLDFLTASLVPVVPRPNPMELLAIPKRLLKRMRLLVQTPYPMDTHKLQMVPQTRRPSLVLKITKANNYKASPLLIAWIKPLGPCSITAIKIRWARGMDEVDTCEVVSLEVAGVDTGVACLVRISLRWSLEILALRARPLHRVQCVRVSQIRVSSASAHSTFMARHRLAVIHRPRPKGKLRLAVIQQILDMSY